MGGGVGWGWGGEGGAADAGGAGGPGGGGGVSSPFSHARRGVLPERGRQMRERQADLLRLLSHRQDVIETLRAQAAAGSNNAYNIVYNIMSCIFNLV